MATKSLQDLFHDALKDIYYAERKIVGALPKMAAAAQSQDLRAAFEEHRMQTETHIERLQEVFAELGERAQTKTCPAIDGIIAEGEETMQSMAGTPALDAGLVAAAQAVEHYEIARYGTLRNWARQLGLGQAVDLLGVTLDEESDTDEKLTALADGGINARALDSAA